AHPRPCERGHRGPGRGSFREEVARGDRQPGRSRVLRAVPVCRRPMVVRGVRDRRDHGLHVAGEALDPLPVGPRRARRPVPATCRRGVASAHRACGTLRNGGSVGVSPILIGLLVLVATLAVLATGLPIAFGLGAVALFFMLVFDGWTSVHYMTDTIFAGLDDFTLVSLPMFVLMGAAVASSRAGSDLYEVLSRWLHRVPGSLVISNIGACALFSALTGSSPATCAAIGKMGIPEMRRRGYDADLATGAIAAGGTLGILIPPSITMILYGIASETSIGRLFIAGVFPGLLLVGLFSLWALFLSWKRGTKLVDSDRIYSLREKFELMPRVLPFIAVIVGVVYALYGGIATPSEASGVGAALCLAMVIVIYRVWKPRDLWAIVRDGLR